MEFFIALCIWKIFQASNKVKNVRKVFVLLDYQLMIKLLENDSKKIFTFTSFTKPLGNQITCKSNEKKIILVKQFSKQQKSPYLEKFFRLRIERNWQKWKKRRLNFEFHKLGKSLLGKVLNIRESERESV